jgi:hypothetical protein
MICINIKIDLNAIIKAIAKLPLKELAYFAYILSKICF